MAKDNFNIIYERNYQRSFMFAKSYVHDDMIAEDIVSDLERQLVRIRTVEPYG